MRHPLIACGMIVLLGIVSVRCAVPITNEATTIMPTPTSTRGPVAKEELGVRIEELCGEFRRETLLFLGDWIPTGQYQRRVKQIWVDMVFAVHPHDPEMPAREKARIEKHAADALGKEEMEEALWQLNTNCGKIQIVIVPKPDSGDSE